VCECFRSPDDWVLTCGGSGQICVWGHNHRGQLGGVDGAKVKLPMSCEALAALRPVQVVGGEQTLFAVTGDGKVLHPLLSLMTLTLAALLLARTGFSLQSADNLWQKL